MKLSAHLGLGMLLLLGSTIGVGQGRLTAAAELDSLLVQFDSVVKSGDMHARLRLLLTYKDFLHDAPRAILSTAHAYAAVGDSAGALSALREYAGLGVSNEDLLSGEDQKFESFSRSAAFQDILKELARNKQPLARGERRVDLAEPGFVPEDIAYDERSGTFLLTSVLEKKILRLTETGREKVFALSPSGWPMFAVKIDAGNRLVWATEVAVDGLAPAPKKDWGHSALLCFDLMTGELKKRIEGPSQAELGDLVLTKDGTPIVCDGKKGGIYKLVNDTLKRLDRGDFISPQTIALTPDKNKLLVPDYERGVGILDLISGEVLWLKNGVGAPLSGVDGLYSYGEYIILTQNGVTPERVVELRLDDLFTRVVSSRIIEKGTISLGDPTHGVVVGHWFYYIANSGWDLLSDSGELKPGAKFTPAHLMRYRLD
jgi:hypothetical protein